MNSIRLLGVTVHDICRDAVYTTISQWLREENQRLMFTPNPEILLHASHDPLYTEALNHADLNLPDGRGIRLVSRIQHTVTGADIAGDLLELAERTQKRVCCVVRSGGRSSLNSVISEVKKQVPQIDVIGFEIEKTNWEDSSLSRSIAEQRPAILLVGLGFPEQELWLDRHIQNIPSATIGMAVGGTFDFWSGIATRAPKFIQKIGFEWLWRFIHEPRRWKRMWNAVIVFPAAVVASHFKKNIVT